MKGLTPPNGSTSRRCRRSSRPSSADIGRRRVGARRVDLLQHLDELRVVERDVVPLEATRAGVSAPVPCLTAPRRRRGRRAIRTTGKHGDERGMRRMATTSSPSGTRPWRRLRARSRRRAAWPAGALWPYAYSGAILGARVVALADAPAEPLEVPIQTSLPSMSAAIDEAVRDADAACPRSSTTLPPTVTFARPRPCLGSRV